MEWLSAVRTAIAYIEDHLQDGVTAADAAAQVFMAPMHFQRGFQIMTGYTVAEYIRCRRLYLAAAALQSQGARVTDAAYDAGYDTPESFTKAFTRFHGATPLQVRQGAPLRTFLPLHLHITVQGGDSMKYRLTNMFGFRMIGFVRAFRAETAQEDIPAFWDEICDRYAKNVYAGHPPANPQEKALMDNCIGEYGVCIDDGTAEEGSFLYMIAGKYTGGEVPEGMMLYDCPQGEWAVFDCVGPVPGALQALNERIFREWLPGNPEWELSGHANVEWYDCINGEKTDADYRSAIWLPVKRKA